MSDGDGRGGFAEEYRSQKQKEESERQGQEMSDGDGRGEEYRRQKQKEESERQGQMGNLFTRSGLRLLLNEEIQIQKQGKMGLKFLLNEERKKEELESQKQKLPNHDDRSLFWKERREECCLVPEVELVEDFIKRVQNDLGEDLDLLDYAEMHSPPPTVRVFQKGSWVKPIAFNPYLYPCKICSSHDHSNINCSYKYKLPREDVWRINTKDYSIVCTCGLNISDAGLCPDSCMCTMRVVNRFSLDLRYQHPRKRKEEKAKTSSVSKFEV